MEANTMVGHRLGQFYEGFSSWRRALARATPEDQPVVFANACSEVAGWISKGLGLDKIDAVDELIDMASSLGWNDADAVQKILSDALKVRSERRGNGGAAEVDWDELAEPDIDLNRDYGVKPEAVNVVQLPVRPQSTKRLPLPIQSSAQFMADWVPPEYLVEDILQRRFIYSLTGKTGAGKTAIALYLAACVALGRPIGDLEVMQGNVLYLAGENPDDVRQRWLAMSQQMDFDYDSIAVTFSSRRVKLSEHWPAGNGELAFVVVDTSLAYYEGEDVNSNTQQGEHARRLRELTTLPGGPAVLVLCHPVKNAADDNLLPLGAGSFLNEMDANLTAKGEETAVELHWLGKIRGPDFAPLSFELARVGHERLVTATGKLLKTVVARPLSDAAREGIEKAASGGARLLLIEINRDQRLSVRDYAAALGWLTTAGKPHTSKVQRALGKLKTGKMITRELDGWAVTKNGQKYLEQSGTAAGAVPPVPEKMAQ